jgi:hypothetical protein
MDDIMRYLKILLLFSITLIAFVQCDLNDSSKKEHYDITIRNNSQTVVEVSINSEKFDKIKTQSIKSKDSYTFELDNPDTVYLYAETSVEIEDEIVGELVYWSGSLSITNEDKENTTDLDVSKNLFFVKMTNTGVELGPIYVQDGSSKKEENILIPNDGKQYDVGYFKYNTSSAATEFGAYKYPSTTNYVYWSLTSDGATNQVKELSNDLTKPVLSAANISAIEIPEYIPTAEISSNAPDLKFEASANHLSSKIKK